MEYFYSEGGNNEPYFRYRIKVKSVTAEMFEWCKNYQYLRNTDFAHWHCDYGVLRDYDVIQFEQEEPALMFALKFGAQ